MLLPFLLGQLEHVDLGHVMQSLLGGAGVATLAGLMVRQWVSGRLSALKKLEKRSERDRLRWKLLRMAMADAAREANRLRQNLHDMRNHQTAVQFAVQRLAEACNVKMNLEDLPDWRPSERPPVDLGDDDDDDEKEED